MFIKQYKKTKNSKENLKKDMKEIFP
jgi:hypothetical protein